MNFSLPGYIELPPGPKLAVTGGRDVQVSREDFAWLLDAFARGFASFVLGDARGVDSEVRALLDEFPADSRWPYEIFIADWKTLGKRAGCERNQRMIDAADALAAFPGGRGTADCIRRAEAKGIPVYRRTS